MVYCNNSVDTTIRSCEEQAKNRCVKSRIIKTISFQDLGAVLGFPSASNAAQSGTAHPTLKTRVLSVYTTSHTHCLWYLAPRRVPCHVLYPQGRRREQDPIRCGTNLTPPRSYVELLHCCYCCRSCCSCSYCRRCVWLCGCVAVPACVTVCCLR